MALSQQEANAVIATKIAQAATLIKECEAIADESGVYFSIEFGGYGSGASYTPKPKEAEKDEDWSSSSSCYEETYGWQASSQSC
jgi:hypothetical protein